MKKTKVIIPALGILLLSTAASVTGTVAWFSANSTVKANGMKVNAKAESALVISDALSVGTETAVNFTRAAETLVPATHDSSVALDGEITFASKSGLLYNNTPNIVDAATGYATSGDLDLQPVPDTLTPYAVDYVVYIAAAGQQKTLGAAEKLNVRLGVKKAVYDNLALEDGSYDTWNALSVDFYVSEDINNKGTYKGTLNLKKSGLGGGSEVLPYENTTPVTLLDGGDIIPINKQNTDYLMITMRVYFDGALPKNEAGTQAYVYSNSIQTGDIGFDATFKID